MRPSLQVLSTELIERILHEAKRVLWEVGIEVRGAQLRQRLLDHGLPAGSSPLHIRFPADVVDQAIASTPSSFKLYNRDGQLAADVGGDHTHFTPGSSGLKILDHRTGATRLANTADFVEYVRLGDGLEHIPYLSTAFSTNDDIEPGVSDAWRLFLCLTQSKKPIVSGAFTEHGVPRMAAMMELFRSGRQELIEKPMAIFTITATGNFRYSEDSCQNLLDCVEAGIPVEIVPVTLMGLIAPVTLVGATVFHTVDVLAGLTMAQIVKPGAPVLFGGAPASFHMREATSPMLGIDALRLDVAYAAVGKHLGLPTQAYMALSDAKFLDAQAGAESFGSGLLAALANINSVSGPGMLDFVLVFSLPKLLLDNAFAGQIHHFRRDIEVNEDLPVAELIDELLREQHLITAEHTLKHWQTQLHMPDRVIDRSNRENWQKAGSPDLDQRSRAEVDRRLAAYHPVKTDPATVAELERLIRDGLQAPDAPLPAIPALPRAHRPVSVQGRPRRRRRR